MAAGATYRGLDIPVMDELGTVTQLALFTVGIFPIKVCNLIKRADDLLGMAMAIQTEAHAQ